MIDRFIEDKILRSLHNFPVVALVGARQVGKTTLALTIKDEYYPDALYLDLEKPSDIDRLENAELYLKHYKDHLVIIDEIQRLPELFPLLRSLADTYRRNTCFLLLGSASPDLVRQSSESLAGRVIYHELPPLLLNETGFERSNRNKLWSRGGYPRSFLAGSDRLSFEWREALIKTCLERDIPQLGSRVPAVRLRRFWKMISHCHGQLWNGSRIAASLGISPPVARHYLDILEDIYIIRQLPPYFPNIKKRLVKSPKIYIRDSGLLHSLLSIRNQDELLAHPAAGASWEGWMIEQIIGMIPGGLHDCYFYRTGGGAEMDLVLVRGDRPEISVEIKRSLRPSLSKSFRHAFADLRTERGFVVYPGEDYYPLDEKVFALPARQLSDIFKNTPRS